MMMSLSNIDEDQEKAQSEASLRSYGILHSKFSIQIEP
jgi:hypothetical protein